MGDGARAFIDYAAAVGDAFLTLDADWTIREVHGPLAWLAGAADPAMLVGRSFLSLLDSRSRKRVSALFAARGDHAEAERAGPVLLKLDTGGKGASACIAFFARHRPDAPIRVVLAATGRFRRLADELVEPALGAEEFAEAVLQPPTGDADAERTVSFIAYPGLPNPDFERELMLRSHERGATVGRLAPNRFAVLHPQTEDDGADAAERFVAALADRFGDKLSWGILTLAPAELADPNQRAAVRLLLNRAADNPDFAFRDLHQDRGLAMVIEAYREVEDLAQRIENRGFDLFYQPIVHLRDGRIHHHEALLRVPSEQGPASFVALAEQSGLIVDLDLAVVDKLLRRLKGMGPQAAAATIAVNLSARSLLADGFVERLLGRLARAGERAKQVIFEVTESARIDDIATLALRLKALHEAGFAVCLDDFGAGMSGFQYLRDLPVDYLKIDGSYVKGCARDGRMREFLQAILGVAAQLKIPTIAEWVETAEEAAMLREMGVTYAQGFYFGRPSPRLVTKAAAALPPKPSQKAASTG